MGLGMNIDGTQQGLPIPLTTESEKEIAEAAPRALAALTKMGAVDLIDILGLRPYVKG